MGAYCTVLTHFSQRYPKLPQGLPEDGSCAVFVAFDGMRLPLSLLPALPLLLPALRAALTKAEDPEPVDAGGVVAAH